MVYGLEYTNLVVLILVCQHCGFAPAHDFDCWLIASGKMKGWYCGQCGCKSIPNPLAGALAMFHTHRTDLCVMSRIALPTGKAANVYSMLKLLNVLRTGDLMLAENALHNVEVLLIAIRAMIVRDNNVAAQVLRATGVRTEFCKVVHLRVSEPFEDVLRIPAAKS